MYQFIYSNDEPLLYVNTMTYINLSVSSLRSLYYTCMLKLFLRKLAKSHYIYKHDNVLDNSARGQPVDYFNNYFF